ncbi:phage protein GemA/Gp16 family protein [Pseudomonas aeruginosa]|uniref:phage protein GemA/Gp16 family protein n=1 Tax=Pseudomonas aeruginosa TaxID=287 RepID=UPI003D6F79F3
MSLRAVNRQKPHRQGPAGHGRTPIAHCWLAAAGVRSAKDLGLRQIDHVLVELQRLGWKPKSNRQAGRRRAPKTGKPVAQNHRAPGQRLHRPWSYGRLHGLAHVPGRAGRGLDDSQLYLG